MVANLNNPNMNRDRDFNDPSIQKFFNYALTNNFLPPIYKKKSKILELGCGNGKTLKNLKEAHPNLEIYGVDKIFLKNNENKTPQETCPSIKFIQKDILDLKLSDFNNQRFNFIFSFRVFIYLDFNEKIKMLEKIYNELLENKSFALIDFGGGVDKFNFNVTPQDAAFFNKYVNKLKNKGIIFLITNYPLDGSQFNEKEKELIIKNNLHKIESFSILMEKVPGQILDLSEAYIK